MFKIKKRNKAVKLSKAEQKEMIKNSIEEAGILTLLFSVFVMLLSEETLAFFKTVNTLSNMERFEVIIFTIPLFLVFSILYTLCKVLITRK